MNVSVVLIDDDYIQTKVKKQFCMCNWVGVNVSDGPPN